MSDCVAAWHLGNEEGTWTHKADSSVYGPPLPSATAACRAPQSTASPRGGEGKTAAFPSQLPPEQAHGCAPGVHRWMSSWSAHMDVLLEYTTGCAPGLHSWMCSWTTQDYTGGCAPGLHRWMCSWSAQVEAWDTLFPRAALLPPRSRHSSLACTKDAQACNSEIRTAPTSTCSRQLSVSI